MPFPFYNTSPPTPSTKNNITDIAVTYGIRDFLLHKNIGPFYPQIGTSFNGAPRVGEPVLDTSINGNSNVVPFGLPLETEGLLRYDVAILPNRFKNTDNNAPTLLNIDTVSTSEGLFGKVMFPQGTQQYPTSATQQITDLGLFGKTAFAGLRESATLRNLYLDTANQMDGAEFISLQPIGYNRQLKGYMDEYGGLNLGGSDDIQSANIIGSVITGQGLGLSKGGVIPNFDLRSSLAGRILGATGTINDTRLGIIGGQQLALALANNAAFNVEQSILGTLNIEDNILDLIKGKPLDGFRPNFNITIPGTTGGRILNYAERILGFTLPRSYLNEAGSIFQYESGNLENIARANNMILNTGKGQVKALISNINTNLIGTPDGYDNPDRTKFRSGYAPAYNDNRGRPVITRSNIYAFAKADGHLDNPLSISDGVIPDLNYLREGKVTSSGFLDFDDVYLEQHRDSNIKTPTYTWVTSVGGLVNSNSEKQPFSSYTKKNLLDKTQLLFNSVGMKTIVSSKGDMGTLPSQISTTNGQGTSKGSAVLAASRFTPDGKYTGVFDTADNTYCRSWTTLDRYDKVSRLIRHRGLDEKGKVPYRHQIQNSVLDSNGFVKIAPYYDPKDKTYSDPKNYMLSIENLAWSDDIAHLPKCEQGPGDLISGKQGRIMWFPPYDINFTENTSINWENNQFIGRGEPLYTYNNTERSGQLSFKIIVDHPTYVNAFRGSNGPDDNYVASFFAGCIDADPRITERLTVSEISSVASKNTTIPQTKNITPETPPDNFSVYYPNASSELNYALGNYENGLSGVTKIDYDNTYTEGAGIGSYQGDDSTTYIDNHNYGLNGWKTPIDVDGVSYSGFSDSNFIGALATYLTEKCPHCVINITSYASPQGSSTFNQELADNRSGAIFDYLMTNLYAGKDEAYKTDRIIIQPNEALTSTDCQPTSPNDSFACKADRRSYLDIEFSNELAEKDVAQPDKTEPVLPQGTTITNRITNRFYTECNWFEKIQETDYFIFDKFREKIRYFHPAFHSTTPEGLNSRLTFLQQCTRQGRTLEEQGANNLAFGRPPVCILRVGDFYNTKIIIDSLNVDYEPLVWDLNSEGIGVQPMIANVNISFKFIGGSTLEGPINKLQNALSFNYYANSQVYDARADYISATPPPNPLGKDVNGNALLGPAYSPTGYYINNDVNDMYNGDANAYNDQDLASQQNISDNTPSLDQEANCADANKGDAPASSASTATTLSIDGFKYVKVNGWGDDPFARTVQVILKQTGLFQDTGNGTNQLVTDDELKAFLNKGIRLTLDVIPQPLSTSRAEDVITATNLDRTDGKDIRGSLFGIGYFMGDEEMNGSFRVKHLIDGNYMLNLFYNGSKIKSLAVNISDTTFTYSE